MDNLSREEKDAEMREHQLPSPCSIGDSEIRNLSLV